MKKTKKMKLTARSDMKHRPGIRRKLADFGLPQDFERMTMILSLRKEADRERSVGRMIGHHVETDDATFASFERDLIIDRVKTAIEGGKKRGKFCGGVPMPGYRSDPYTKKLIVDPDEAKTVRLIFEKYVALESIQATVSEINRLGLRTREWVSVRNAFDGNCHQR